MVLHKRPRRQSSRRAGPPDGCRSVTASGIGDGEQIHFWLGTCGMSDRERQCGVLPYSLVPGAGGVLDMALLVFRDPAGSNSLQSGRFFSELVCARDADKGDRTLMDAAARVFSERTRGIFAPRASASASASPDVDLSRRILAQKLRKQEGIVQLAHSLYRIYLVPVRHASEAELRTALPLDTCVEAHWVLVPALLAALSPDQNQTRRNTSDLTISCADRSLPALPLYLPFSTLMQQPAVLSQLDELAERLQAQVGGKTIRVRAASVTAAVAASHESDSAADCTAKSASASESSGGTHAALSSMHADPFAWSATDGGDDCAVDSAIASTASAVAAASTDDAKNKNETSYLCKFCRHVLFHESDLKPHEGGDGQTNFAYRKRSTSTKIECTSYFVHSLAWIRSEDFGVDDDGNLDAADALSENEGKIVCPNLKCGNRVGSHNWSGAQCACGAWVVPAIQFLKKTVDLRHPVSAATTAALTGARPLAIVRPIGGARAAAARPPLRQSVAATDSAATANAAVAVATGASE